MQTKSNNFRLFVFLLFVFAIIIRLPFLQRDISLDESFSYFMAKQPANYIISGHDVHPPAYYLFLKPFAETIGNNIFYLRLTTLVTFLIFAILFYYYTKYKIGDIGAIVGTSFVLLSPTMLFFSTELRMYSLILLFIMCIIILLENWTYNLFYITLFCIFLLHIHYFTIFFVIIVLLFVFLRNKFYSFYMALAIAILSIPLLVYHLLPSLQHLAPHFSQPPNLMSYISTFTYFITTPFTKMGGFFIPIIFLLIFMLAYKTKLDYQKNIFYYQLWLVPLILMTAMSFIIPVHHHRYILYSAIGFYLLIAVYAQKIAHKTEAWMIIPTLLIVAILCSQTAMYGELYDNVIQQSLSTIPQDATITHTSTFSYMPYAFYLENTQFKNQLFTRMTKNELFMVGGVLIPDEKIYRSLPDNTIIVSTKPYGKTIYASRGLYVSEN